MRPIGYFSEAGAGVLARMRSAIFLLLLALQPFSVAGAADQFDSEFDEKPWAEIEVQLPAFPETENLIPFQVGAIRDRQFFIDGPSISIGSDEVIRFSVVVISASGARNISFEGLRCATGERRLYAFGRADKTWSRAKSDQWMKLKGYGNQYFATLFADYFCGRGEPAVGSVEEAIRVLRYGR